MESSDVDLVGVTVKVSHHRGLVPSALEAGKHVYCEWPPGNGVAEARKLAALAEAGGVVGRSVRRCGWPFLDDWRGAMHYNALRL